MGSIKHAKTSPVANPLGDTRRVGGGDWNSEHIIDLDVSDIDGLEARLIPVEQVEQFRDDALQFRNEAAGSASDAAASAAEAAATLADRPTRAELAEDDATDGFGYASNGPSPRSQTVREVLNKTVRLSSISAVFGPNLQLANAITTAINNGATLKVDEHLVVSQSTEAPEDLRLAGAGGSLTQSAVRTPIFVCNTPGWREFHKVELFGLGTDYINDPIVFPACGILLSNGASADVFRCKLNNFSGSGLRALEGSAGFKIDKTEITGPGTPAMTGPANNFGACVSVDNNVQNWSVRNSELSFSPQGIVTGDGLANVFITGNYIHDIVGQHGAYIETVNGFVYDGNMTQRTGLCGMKIQVGTIAAPDAVACIVTNSQFIEVGSHAILFTNPPGGVPRIRKFYIGGIVGKSTAGADAGIYLHKAISGIVNGAQFTGFGRVMNMVESEDITVSNVRGAESRFESLRVENCMNCSFNNLVLQNSAKAMDSATAWGVHVLGASSAKLYFNNVRSTDDFRLVRSSLWVEDGDQASMEFDACTFTGGTQFGARMISGKPVGRWTGIVLEGLQGQATTFPTAYLVVGGLAGRYTSPRVTVPPTSGIFNDGDVIEFNDQTANLTQGMRCVTAGAGHSAMWATAATYAVGVWLRNTTSVRVYRVEVAGPGATSAEPVGTTVGATETTADGYTWRLMGVVAAFAPLPLLGTPNIANP